MSGTLEALSGYRTTEQLSMPMQVCCGGGAPYFLMQTVVLCRAPLSALLADFRAAQAARAAHLPTLQRLLRAALHLASAENRALDGRAWLCWPEGCEEAVTVLPSPAEEAR